MLLKPQTRYIFYINRKCCWYLPQNLVLRKFITKYKVQKVIFSSDYNMSIYQWIAYEIDQTIMLSKSCTCRIKWKHWKKKTGNYIFKNRLLFREKAKIIRKYFYGNLEEGNEPAIISISLMKKSSSGNSFCRSKKNTLSIEISQQQDGPEHIQQKQLPLT